MPSFVEFEWEGKTFERYVPDQNPPPGVDPKYDKLFQYYGDVVARLKETRPEKRSEYLWKITEEAKRHRKIQAEKMGEELPKSPAEIRYDAITAKMWRTQFTFWMVLFFLYLCLAVPAFICHAI